MNYTLYPWQEECLQAWSENHYHGIVNVVTGAGKTIMALTGIKRLENTFAIPLRVKIIVPKTFMVFQWASCMLDSFSISRDEIGYYYGSQKDSPRRKYTVYVITMPALKTAKYLTFFRCLPITAAAIFPWDCLQLHRLTAMIPY